jgi:hypothetical protein
MQNLVSSVIDYNHRKKFLYYLTPIDQTNGGKPPD